MRGLLKRGRIGLVAASLGGSVLVLEGCDPTVRGTVLSGVEGASTTLVTTIIQAFFESLLAQDEGDATIVRHFAASEAPLLG